MSTTLKVAIVIGVLSAGLASQSVLAQTGTLEQDETEHAPIADPLEPFNQKCSGLTCGSMSTCCDP